MGRVGRRESWDPNCNNEVPEECYCHIHKLPYMYPKENFFFSFNEVFKGNIHMVKIHIVAKKLIQ